MAEPFSSCLYQSSVGGHFRKPWPLTRGSLHRFNLKMVWEWGSCLQTAPPAAGWELFRGRLSSAPLSERTPERAHRSALGLALDPPPVLVLHHPAGLALLAPLIPAAGRCEVPFTRCFLLLLTHTQMLHLALTGGFLFCFVFSLFSESKPSLLMICMVVSAATLATLLSTASG